MERMGTSLAQFEVREYHRNDCDKHSYHKTNNQSKNKASLYKGCLFFICPLGIEPVTLRDTSPYPVRYHFASNLG